MAKRPTEKDTKKVIIEYLAEVEKELKDSKEGKFKPEDVRKEEHKKEVEVKAASILGRGILSQEILDEHEALKEDIKNKEAYLKALYGIDVKAETLAALIESNNIEIATFKVAKDELIAEKTAELGSLQEQYNEKKAKLDKEYTDKKAEIDLKLERDKANAKYDLDRTKKVDNDAWADDKAKREAELASKEKAVTEREVAVTDKEADYKLMEAEVASIPEKIAAATKKIEEDSEKKITTVLAIRKAAIEKEAELDKKLVDQELAATKKALAEEKENSKAFSDKLDAAYRQMNELATKTAQSAQPAYSNKDNK